MEPRFLTVSKSDSDYRRLLTGRYSPHQRAVPIKTLGANTKNERITFRLSPVSEIQRPNWLKVWVQAIRPEWLPLSVGPLLVMMAALNSREAFYSQFLAVVAIFSVFCFHAAVFLFNDYQDHLRGVDRLNKYGGSRVIQTGWLPAYRLRAVAWVFGALGALAGAMVIVEQPVKFSLVAVVVAIAVLGYSFSYKGFKYIGLGDLLVFVCFGPLLTYGFVQGVAQSFFLGSLVLGVVYGHLAVTALQARQLQNIIYDTQAGIHTIVSRLGFDRAKRLIRLQLRLNLLILLLWLIFAADNVLVIGGVAGGYAIGLLRIDRHVRNTTSPLSSSMSDVHLKISQTHLLLSILLFASFAMGWVHF